MVCLLIILINVYESACYLKNPFNWAKVYGGTNMEFDVSLAKTRDGGYVVAGRCLSYGVGASDFLVIKIDTLGNIIWSNTYGGGDADYAPKILQTEESGYIIAGCTYSFGVTGYDFLVIKIDSIGNVEWAKTFGGGTADGAHSVKQTFDKGYIVVRESSLGAGLYDCLVTKIDSLGNVVWEKTYGSNGGDAVGSVFCTSDTEYILSGWTDSFGAGSADFLVIKMNSLGNIIWNKIYGGTGWDCASVIIQTGDGKYTVIGETTSFGAGNTDFLIFKTERNGLMVNTCPIQSCTLIVTAPTINMDASPVSSASVGVGVNCSPNTTSPTPIVTEICEAIGIGEENKLVDNIELYVFSIGSNKFNIKHKIHRVSYISIKIYDLSGKLVEVIFEGMVDYGIHNILWDGSSFVSGVYLCEFRVNGSKVNKIILIRR